MKMNKAIFLQIFAVLVTHALSSKIELSKSELELLASRTNDLDSSVNFGIESIDNIKRLERNLASNGITITRGSFSHSTLIDSLPNNFTIKDQIIALKILKSGQHFFNSVCAPEGIDGQKCHSFLAENTIPKTTTLYKQCARIVAKNGGNYQKFRRLLPAYYMDGFYEIAFKTERPSPRSISKHFKSPEKRTDTAGNNLLISLLGQFLEHDISKPVLSTMQDGTAIECCSGLHTKSSPRYQHPNCAPILETVSEGRYSKEICLNYVRSGLTPPQHCNFDYGNQMNKASGRFDLSQLYGHSNSETLKIRRLQMGQLNHSLSKDLEKLHQSILPAEEGGHTGFCSYNSTGGTKCFIAGDSRVNRSPFTILMYTLFLRNHNQLAKMLASRETSMTDDQLFEKAKILNIAIYNNIIFDEWLPSILGPALVRNIKENTVLLGEFESSEISSEFALGPLRFYWSMLPNNIKIPSNRLDNKNVEIIHDFNLRIYKPSLNYTPALLNDILESVLQENARQCDKFYEENLIPDSLIDGNVLKRDILAFDIQRGRDHGLPSYVDYLEKFYGKKIASWSDLENFISHQDIETLRSLYKSWEHIDFLIGGISEKVEPGSILGKTFSKIFVEQFSVSYKWYSTFMKANENVLSSPVVKMNAAAFICANSDLKHVPVNPFNIPSEKNPLKLCSDYITIFEK